MDLSDEEKHAIELRRERSNKISKLMGEYLLKGYKMLGSTCNRCGTILMRDRQKNDYCVACNDIDGIQDTTSPSTTIMRITGESPLNEERSQARRTENMDTGEREHTIRQLPMNNNISLSDEYFVALRVVQDSVIMKMQWASQRLQNCGLDESLKLLELIRACQDTIDRLISSCRK